MRRILCLSVLAATCAWADDATDRQGIERLITTVNNHSEPLADLFTADAPQSEKLLLLAQEEPWSEVTSPRIATRSIRFISPQIALVECTSTQYGSVVIVRITAMLLVVKKDGAQWRIACVLALRDSPGVAKLSLDR